MSEVGVVQVYLHSCPLTIPARRLGARRGGESSGRPATRLDAKVGPCGIGASPMLTGDAVAGHRCRWRLGISGLNLDPTSGRLETSWQWEICTFDKRL